MMCWFGRGVVSVGVVWGVGGDNLSCCFDRL